MLTPRDIDTKVFKQVMRGYSVDEVETFLQEISVSYEMLYRENLAAKERVKLLSDAVRQYKAMEDSMQKAVPVAKDEIKAVQKAAADQADAVVEEAKGQARDVLDHAAQELAKVTYQYEQMKRNVEVYRAKVVSLLHAQLDIIKDYEEISMDETAPTGTKAVTDTMEIPEIVQNEAGDYIAKTEE